MRSVVSLVIGTLLTGYVLLEWAGVFEITHDEGDLLNVVSFLLFSLVANVVGLVLGVSGILLQERRRVALAGVALNAWPWCFAVVGALLGGC